MKLSFKKFLEEKGVNCPTENDEISEAEFKKIERFLDSLFSSLNVDIAFTKHFKERVNDERNKKQITQCELVSIYTEVYKKFGRKISKTGGAGDIEKIIKSLSTSINIPVIMKYDRQKKEVVMVAKTAMRKKAFKHKEPAMQVENEDA